MSDYIGNGTHDLLMRRGAALTEPEPSVPVRELHELIDAIIELASAIRSLDKSKGATGQVSKRSIKMLQEAKGGE